MVKDNKRICDICNVEIPKGTTYQARTLAPEQAAMFFAIEVHDPDMLPNWTQNPDGTVQMDICMDCYLSMSFPSNAS